MYRVLTDEDLARVIAWMRSVPEATDTLPARTFGPLGRPGLLMGEFHPSRYYIETETIPPPPEDTALRAGHYIAWSSCTGICGGCATDAVKREQGCLGLRASAASYVVPTHGVCDVRPRGRV